MKSKYYFISPVRNLIPSIQNSTIPTLAQLKKQLCFNRPFFGRASTPDQTKTRLKPRLYPFITQATVLPGSDAGNDVVKSPLSFVIQNRQTCAR